MVYNVHGFVSIPYRFLIHLSLIDGHVSTGFLEYNDLTFFGYCILQLLYITPPSPHKDELEVTVHELIYEGKRNTER